MVALIATRRKLSLFGKTVQTWPAKWGRNVLYVNIQLLDYLECATTQGPSRQPTHRGNVQLWGTRFAQCCVHTAELLPL